jgi:hypothetical protein
MESHLRQLRVVGSRRGSDLNRRPQPSSGWEAIFDLIKADTKLDYRIYGNP